MNETGPNRENPTEAEPRAKGRVRQFFAELGPGLITGAADDDPSGISTYSTAGAAFGYLPLWMAPFAFPLMAAVQLMCARLGLAGGSRAALLSALGVVGSVRTTDRGQCFQYRRGSGRNG